MRSAPVHGDVAGGHVDMELSDLHVSVELGKMSGRAMDRLTGADHQLGGIEWHTQDLGCAKADRIERSLHAVIPYEDQYRLVRLVYLGGRVFDPPLRRRLRPNPEIPARPAGPRDR